MTVLNYKTKIFFTLSLIVFNFNNNMAFSVGNSANEHRATIGKYHAKHNVQPEEFHFNPRINYKKALPYLALLCLTSVTTSFVNGQPLDQNHADANVDAIHTTDPNALNAVSNSTENFTRSVQHFNPIQASKNPSVINCFEAAVLNMPGDETNGSELTLYSPQLDQHDDGAYASFSTDDKNVSYFNDLVTYNKVEISGLTYEFINPDDSYANLIKKSFFNQKTAIKLIPSNHEITGRTCFGNKHPDGSIEVIYNVIINNQKSKTPLKIIVYKNTPYFSNKINNFNFPLKDLLSDGKFHYRGYEYALKNVSGTKGNIETIKIAFDNFDSVELIFTELEKNSWREFWCNAQLFIDDTLINKFSFIVNESKKKDN